MTDTALTTQQVTPMELLQSAISQGLDIGVIERLASLQMQFTDRADKIAFRDAMTKFKDDMPKIIRSRGINDKEGKEKYKVVALEDVADPVMKALVKLGITYRYKTADLPDGRIRVTCILGMQGTAYEEEGSTLAAPPDTAGGKDALKAVGSTASYLEKYTLMASVGMHVYGADPEAVEPTLPEDVTRTIMAMLEAPTLEQVTAAYKPAVTKAFYANDTASGDALRKAYKSCEMKLKGEAE